jgi:hypothetical protein
LAFWRKIYEACQSSFSLIYGRFWKGVLRIGMFFERYLTVITRWISAFSRFLAGLISALKNTPHSRNLFLAGPIFVFSCGELSNEIHVKDNDDPVHGRDKGHRDGMIPVKVIRLSSLIFVFGPVDLILSRMAFP